MADGVLNVDSSLWAMSVEAMLVATTSDKNLFMRILSLAANIHKLLVSPIGVYAFLSLFWLKSLNARIFLFTFVTFMRF